METTFYKLGETGLMRVKREPGTSLELAYFDGQDYVYAPDLVRFLVLEDRDEATQITTEEARRRESSIRRREATGGGVLPPPAESGSPRI